MKRLKGFVLKYVQSLLERHPALARWYLFHVWRRTHGQQPYVDWARIIARDEAWWTTTRQRTKTGPKVLLATSVGGHQVASVVESALVAALTLRGAESHVLLCDTALPACFKCTIAWYPKLSQFMRHGPQRDLCHLCYEPGARTFAALGVTIHRYSDFLTDGDRASAAHIAETLPATELAGFRFEGHAVGEHAMAGTLRFFGCATLDQEPHGEIVLRRYLHAALLTLFALRRLLQSVPFEAAVFHHGLYVPLGLIGEVCRKQGVRVVNWGATYRQQCFLFSHEDTYHHTLMSEPVSTWEDLSWPEARQFELLDYLKSRWHGTRDWIRVHDDPDTDPASVKAQLGLDPSKPAIGLLTNVMWDAQVCYPANAFPTMRDWVFSTIRYFAKRPQLQLLIRIHPAEAHRGPLQARQLILREIEAEFPSLPPNIKIIPATSRISTYVAMGECNAVLIFATKAGVELAATGMPVIVAGEAWVRNKGITLDARSETEYLSLLDTLPLARPGAATTVRACKYAYHFFFRRMIPFGFVERGPNGPRLKATSLHELLPGRDLGLDVVCNGILQGGPFVYPAECLEARATGAMPPVVHDLM